MPLSKQGLEKYISDNFIETGTIDNFKLSKVYLLDNWSTLHFHKNESIYNNVVNMFKKFDGTVEVIKSWQKNSSHGILSNNWITVNLKGRYYGEN